MSAAARTIDWVEQGLVPDPVVRHGIRRLVRARLAELAADDCETAAEMERQFVDAMDRSPIAPLPESANEQHYEVPPEFFAKVLGPHRKYSCCLWDDGTSNLEDAEAAALGLTAARAEIADGMKILELGSGWGSLTLWLAELFPHSDITAVSNSASQRDFVQGQAAARGLGNVTVIQCDMNDFETKGAFDRVISVEMFEHMRNYRQLFGRIHRWLRPGGKFFMHIFCHRSTPYEFVDRGAGDWMSRHFFTGGIMPSDGLPLFFQDRLLLRGKWRWDGRHYFKTSEAWLANMDDHKREIMPILKATYGSDAVKWWVRWRLFFMACAELFNFDDGQRWHVGHYLFERPARAPAGDA